MAECSGGKARTDDERRAARHAGAGLVALVLFGMAGCGAVDEVDPGVVRSEVVRPALIQSVGAIEEADKMRFPGRLRAAKRAELSFDVPGFVADFPLEEGTRVRAGQVVARLDSEVFKARLTAARAEFERARTDLARYQRLWDTEFAVARSEVDDRLSRVETARTNLAAAEQDLAATVIKAPFDGVLTRRRLETFANVQAKQPIAELQDLRALEAVINVPERVLRNARARAGAIAVLEGDPATRLTLSLKSYAAEADPLTQSYQVVLKVDALPPGMLLLPGMSVTVLPFADPPSSVATAIAVPLTAIVVDAGGKPRVWVVDADGSVAPRPVVTGDVRGGEIVIESGLKSGERIVAVGAAALREGMKVRALQGVMAAPQ